MSTILKKAGLIFDENKVKPFLKMSITRLNLLVNKKANHIKISKKEIARLLADGKEEKARIKVEQVIREDFTIEAYDILELHCELLAERMRLVTSQKDVPPDMDQAVCTIIWAADRAEVSELSTVKSQFQKKYGGEYVRAAELNEGGCVNPKVVEKLDCQPPSGYIITEYLIGIAEEYDVEYTPTIAIRRKSTEPDPPSAGARGPRPAYEAPSHHHPMGGGGDSGGGEGGIASPPAVTAWAIPPGGIPQAAPAVVSPPEPSRGGEGRASAGGGVSGVPGAYTLDDKSHLHTDETQQQRRGSGGYEAATKGWGPSRGEGKFDGGGSEEPRKASGGFEGATKGWGPSDGGVVEDAPPPYSPPRAYNHHDIPSPPRTAPVTAPVTFDIPAAPGYEDPPLKPDSKADEPPASSEGGTDFDDLAARFMNLRK